MGARHIAERRERLRHCGVAVRCGARNKEYGIPHVWHRAGRGADFGRAALRGRERHGGRAGHLRLRRTARRATASASRASAAEACAGWALLRRCGSCVRRRDAGFWPAPLEAEAVTAKRTSAWPRRRATDGAGHRGGKRGVSWHGLVHPHRSVQPGTDCHRQHFCKGGRRCSGRA